MTAFPLWRGAPLRVWGLDRLMESPVHGANTIAWLVWHLARVQDSHVAALLLPTSSG